MDSFGITYKETRIFLPPYEWYNDSIAAWCREIGVTLINNSPGTIAQHDWTFPGGSVYYSSDGMKNQKD